MPYTLTKPEFLATQRQKGIKKPDYGAYLRYVKAARKKPPTPPSAPKPQGQQLPTLDSLLRLSQSQLQTPAQMEAQARRMAQLGVDAQMKMIREEAALMRNEARTRAEAMAAAGRAAAQMNAGLFEQVGGEYNAGAQEMRAMATGLGGAAGGATAADVAGQNASLANIGAPALAEGGAMSAPSIAGATQTGVEAFRGGEIPAQALGTAGEAAKFGLAGLVSSQNLRATQEGMAAWRQATAEINSSRTAAIKELAAGRPAAAAQFLQQLQEAQRQQIALAQGLIGARQASKAQALQQKLTVKKFNIDMKQVDRVKSQMNGFVTYVDGTQPRDAKGNRIPVSKLMTPQERAALAAQTQATRIAATQARIAWDQVDVTKSMAKKFLVDMEGDYVLDENGKKIPSSRLKSATTKATLTPGQKVELMAQGQAVVENNYDKQRGYSTTVKQLVTLGIKKSVAIEMANAAYARGEGPGGDARPIFSDAEKKKIGRRLGTNRVRYLVDKLQKLYAEGSVAEADEIVAAALSGQPIIIDGEPITWAVPRFGKK